MKETCNYCNREPYTNSYQPEKNGHRMEKVNYCKFHYIQICLKGLQQVQNQKSKEFFDKTWDEAKLNNFMGEEL